MLGQPRRETGDDRTALVLPDGATFLVGETADIVLDFVELGDSPERFAGNGCRTGGGQFIEAPTHMAPAECQGHAVAGGERSIAHVPVHLQDTDESIKMRHRAFALAIGRIDINDTGRVDSLPWPVVAA